MLVVRCRSGSGLEGADTHLGGGCVVISGGTSQEWSVSVLGGVQQWVGPGGDRHIVGGGDQQLVRPGVEGHAAGCVMWWFTGVSQTWRGMENYWVVWVDSVYLVF